MTGLIEITTSYSNFRSNFLLFLSFPAASSPSSSPSQVSLLWCLIFPLEEQDNHRLGNNCLIGSRSSLLAFLPLPFLSSCGCLFAHLTQASSGNGIAYEYQKEKIFILRPVSPSQEYPLQVITVMAPSSPWVWGERRVLMLCLWHKGTLTASVRDVPIHRRWGFSYWILRRCPLLSNLSWLCLGC